MENRYRTPTIEELFYTVPAQIHIKAGMGITPLFENGGQLNNIPVAESSPVTNLFQSNPQQNEYWENGVNFINKNWEGILFCIIVSGIVLYCVNKNHTEKEKNKYKATVPPVNQTPTINVVPAICNSSPTIARATPAQGTSKR